MGFKKGLAILTIVGGVYLVAEQNGTGKEHNYILGLSGGVVAVMATKYLSGLRKESQFPNRPYKIIGDEIILDPSQYSITNSKPSEKQI